MPAAPLIAAVAIDAAATEAATAALTAITSATFAATLTGTVIAGAVGGAVGGAITGAAFGGDPGMSALTGAISGGISGGVGSELKGVSPIEVSLGKAAAGLGAGTLSGLAQGENFGQALKGGAVSGIASGIASGLGQEVFGGNQGPIERQPGNRIPTDNAFSGTSFPVERTPPSRPSFLNQQIQNASTGALQHGIQTGLNDLVGPSPSGGGQSATSNLTTPSNFNPTPTDIALGGGSPSVAALAQALRTVPDLGYSPGGPVFGSDASKANRKVWNKASLRVTDDQNQ